MIVLDEIWWNSVYCWTDLTISLSVFIENASAQISAAIFSNRGCSDGVILCHVQNIWSRTRCVTYKTYCHVQDVTSRTRWPSYIGRFASKPSSASHKRSSIWFTDWIVNCWIEDGQVESYKTRDLDGGNIWDRKLNHWKTRATDMRNLLKCARDNFELIQIVSLEYFEKYFQKYFWNNPWTFAISFQSVSAPCTNAAMRVSWPGVRAVPWTAGKQR